MPVVVVTGTPVEVTGCPVDIEGQPTASAAPVVTGIPLTNHLTGLNATPTPESEQKSYFSLLTGAIFQAIIPVIILSNYYREEWATAYCEEMGLASWALVFGLVGISAVAYQLLINVWFWRINWKYFTTGGEVAVKQTYNRKKWLDLSNTMVGLFNFGWFCYGQSMIWGTTGCDDVVYDEITRGDWPGCAAASDGRLTCELEPRPGCCFKPMHEFARVYSIVCFVLSGVLIPCMCCIACFLMQGAQEQRLQPSS